MKKENIVAARLLLIASCVLKKKNINFASSLKGKLINITNLAFMIDVFTAKNIVNIYKKNIALSAKNIQVKIFVKSMIKCHQNILH